MLSCAQIDGAATPEIVVNMIVVREEDYDWLSDIWDSLWPGQYLAHADDLEPEDGYQGPVWINWTREPSGKWVPPIEEQIPPESPEDPE